MYWNGNAVFFAYKVMDPLVVAAAGAAVMTAGTNARPPTAKAGPAVCDGRG